MTSRRRAARAAGVKLDENAAAPAISAVRKLALENVVQPCGSRFWNSLMPPNFRTIATAVGDVIAAARNMPAAFVVAFLAQLASKSLDRVYIPDPTEITFDGWFVAFTSVKTVVLGLVIAPFAVLIHRRIILGEEGRLRTLTSLGSRVTEFYIAFVVLKVVIGLPAAAAAVAAEPHEDPVSLTILTILWIAALYVSFRMVLLFPAIATGAPGRSVSSAFRRSRGLVWRTFFAGVVIALAMRALEEGAKFGAGWISQPAEEIVGVVASALAQLVITAAMIAIASRFFLWRRDADAAIGSALTLEAAPCPK